MPNIYKCTRCNREVWWEQRETFNDLVGKQYKELNKPIVCCECDGDPRNGWFPRNPTKDLIHIIVSEHHVCSECGRDTGWGSSGGRVTLGDKKDNGRHYEFNVKSGLCDDCRNRYLNKRRYDNIH
jgi:DNA-directed RNA polymerase subunit RPC12/RpoP